MRSLTELKRIPCRGGELFIERGHVTMAWWTHVAKGLHRNDFIMAARTDQLFAA